MTKLQTMFASLVAVVPAAAFAVVMAMAILNSGGKMGGMIWIANGIALLCSAAILAMPFVLLYQHIKERKEERQAVEDAAQDEVAEEGVDEEAVDDEMVHDEESTSDMLGEDFFDDGDELGTSGVLVSETLTGDQFANEMSRDDFGDDDDLFAEESGVVVTESTQEISVGDDFSLEDEISLGDSDEMETADALEAYSGPGVDLDEEEEAYAETEDFNLDDEEETGEITVTESSTSIDATDDFDLGDFLDEEEMVAVTETGEIDLDEDEDESADAVAMTDDFDLDEMGLGSERDFIWPA
ncbi:MAG: hypothetical protein R3C11_08930 [Planctomycetaceae bacterium]